LQREALNKISKTSSGKIVKQEGLFLLSQIDKDKIKLKDIEGYNDVAVRFD